MNEIRPIPAICGGATTRQVACGRRDAVTKETQTEPITGQPLVPDPASPVSAQEAAASDDCEEPTQNAYLDIRLKPVGPSQYL